MGSAAGVVETERKYDSGERSLSGDLGGILGEIVQGEPRLEQLSATYHDTAGLSLLRSGVTLRRLEGGHDSAWHLTLPAGPDAREEIRSSLRIDDRTPPDELLALVRVHTRGEPLVPVALVTTERRGWELSDDDGVLLELVEDTVTARTMGSSTRTLSWREIEVELGRRGEPTLLDQVERELERMNVRRAGQDSTLLRVLGDPQPDSTTFAAEHGSAAAAVLTYIDEQVGLLRRHDPLARRDAPDAVHQIRTTSRRLRSALQAYRNVLRRAETEPLVEELTWLGGEFAEARDGEVMLERLTGAVRELPGELVMGSVSANLIRRLGRRHADGHRRAVAALDSERYLRLHDLLDGLLSDPPLTSRATRPAEKELPIAVAKAWRRTAERYRAARRGDEGSAELRLHEARKAGKRLRYAIEVAEPVVGKPATRTRRRLKAWLSPLGTHQDAATVSPVLRELAARAHLDGGNGFTYGVLHGEERLRAHQARQAIPAAWERLDRRKHRRWLLS